MKILILTSSTNLKFGGGMDKVIHFAEKELKKEFTSVQIINGVNFIQFIKGIFLILIKDKLKYDFIIINSLAAIRSRYNPYGKFYVKLLKLFNKKIVYYWHEMPDYWNRIQTEKDIKSIKKLITEKKHIHLACSMANGEFAKHFETNPNIKIINNCVPNRNYLQNLVLNKFTVVTVGSIQWRKGADLWTETAIKTCLKNPNINFIWCGGPTDQKLYMECLEKISENNLESQIIFLGQIEDAFQVTQFSHLYFMCSREDSFALSVIEAMSFEKNIVYFDSGGVVEQVAEHGILIPNFGIDKAVNAILKQELLFVENSDAIFNKELRKRFEAQFTPEIFAKKLKNALE